MHGFELYERATHRHSFWTGLGKLGRSHWAMVLGHMGLAVIGHWYCAGIELRHRA